MHALITGSAGFIGFHLAQRLLAEGWTVTGIDNLNDYYSVALKKARTAELEKHAAFTFIKADLTDADTLETAFSRGRFTHVVNLAAQPGVRYSLINPKAYIASNITGFANLLECCRDYPVRHLLFASSSSVYGLDSDVPYAPQKGADHPVSLYAATKRSNELMAHSYSHLFGIPCTGLRFFTVYGPWGRPDMALSLFTSAIMRGEPIRVFNEGRMRRDFTYVDDIVEGLFRLMELPPEPDPSWNSRTADPSTSSAPWRILNIGGDNPIELNTFIKTIEDVIGRRAERILLPMQDGDVRETWSDTSGLRRLTGFVPRTDLHTGISRFFDWYRDYYKGSEGKSTASAGSRS